MKSEGNLFPKKPISPSDKTDMSVSILSRRLIIQKTIFALSHKLTNVRSALNQH